MNILKHFKALGSLVLKMKKCESALTIHKVRGKKIYNFLTFQRKRVRTMLNKTSKEKYYEVLSHKLILAHPEARSINLITCALNHITSLQ